jgi:hypothetical protein
MSVSLIALAVLMMALPPSAPPADDINVNGSWTLTTETPRGTRNQDVEFVQDGEKLTVIPAQGEWAPSEGHGTLKGDKITWSWKVQSHRGEMTITFTGTVSGDSMAGTVSRPSGEGNWSAKRKPASTPAATGTITHR